MSTTPTTPTPKQPRLERLPCKLTPEEIAAESLALAHQINARDALTLEKQLAVQRFAKDLKEAERRIGDLAEAVRTGVEYRQIATRDEPDFERGVVEIIRVDTGAVVRKREMRADERQAELFPKARQLAFGELPGANDDDDEAIDYDAPEPDAPALETEH